ncbi:MAG: hypothetical protein K2X27_03245 [Candidatus Obscuribacterales bacterium]|nr:hypothetical protein [Candidatus Obscuribacterales bacterium]
MGKKLSLLLAAGFVTFGWQPAFAHGDEHHNNHGVVNRQEKQIHKLERQGAISPQQHAAADAQLQNQQYRQDSRRYGKRHHGLSRRKWQSTWLTPNNPNYGYYQTYNSYWQQHPQDHMALEQAEQKYHQLVAQGVLTPQEHASLDAQLQAQHARSDALQNNFNTYGNPYINQQMPGIINKLRGYFGF